MQAGLFPYMPPMCFFGLVFGSGLSLYVLLRWPQSKLKVQKSFYALPTFVVWVTYNFVCCFKWMDMFAVLHLLSLSLTASSHESVLCYFLISWFLLL